MKLVFAKVFLFIWSFMLVSSIILWRPANERNIMLALTVAHLAWYRAEQLHEKLCPPK